MPRRPSLQAGQVSAEIAQDARQAVGEGLKRLRPQGRPFRGQVAAAGADLFHESLQGVQSVGQNGQLGQTALQAGLVTTGSCIMLLLF